MTKFLVTNFMIMKKMKIIGLPIDLETEKKLREICFREELSAPEIIRQLISEKYKKIEVLK